MIRWSFVLVMSLLATSAWADSGAQGFQKRFQLVKNAEGKTVGIRLKTLSAGFGLRPFIEQVKNDLLEEQRRWSSKSAQEREEQIDSELIAMGLDPYAKEGEENALAIKDSLMNIPNIKVEESFQAIQETGLMKEFEAKISEALMQLDLAMVANLEDPRFFYRHNVAYSVVNWALDQAKKRFASVPVLNLASFVIVKVHDLLIEQKTFHHNMLLHYFQVVPETELGMTKDEVDRAVSSIYEYRISALSYQESNQAAQNWARYGWNKFYVDLRYGNTRERELASDSARYASPVRLDFAFSEFTQDGGKKIFHLLAYEHLLSGKPALAYDYANPGKVKRQRALLNLAQVALGFLPVVPGWIKSIVDSFIDSTNVEQRRLEGALVPYFEMANNAAMVKAIYGQSSNPYLVQ